MTISKAFTDYSWNFISLGILAASGILINLIILKFFSVDALGIFNQTYALFVIFSQLSVLGIHYSVLKRSSEVTEERQEYKNIFLGGVLAVFICASTVTIIFYASSSLFSKVLDSVFIEDTIKIVSPALLLFSINKVIASFLNGQEKMKYFAIINITRYISLITFLLIFINLGFTEVNIIYMFFFSELIVLIMCLSFSYNYIGFFSLKSVILSAINHIKFGIKALFSGIFVELNFRIDVIILGVFTSDAVVGIYSFFSLIAEGLYNIYVVIKNIINPKIVKIIKSKNIQDLRSFVYSYIKIVYPLSLVLIPIIGILIFYIISFLPDAELLRSNFEILLILFSFIFLISGFIPFEMILTLAGMPGLQSFQSLLVCIINLSLNLILVPIYFGIGAAISTGISFVAGIFIIYIIITRKLVTKFN